VNKAFEANKQPKCIDRSALTDSAVLDGGKSQVAELTLSKPGQYLFFAPSPTVTATSGISLKGC
jgi:hypothetical protein